MTLDQLKVFAAVVEYQCLTEAAGVLRVSQPGITQQLKRLQDECGAVFYRRNGRGIEITQSGKEFFNRIKPILRQIGVIENHYKKARNVVRPEVLKVGGTSVTSLSLLPELLGQLKKSKPAVEIEFRARPTERLETIVLKSIVEIGMGMHRPLSNQLTAEAYRKAGLVLFAAPDHPLARKQRVTLSDVLSAPWLVRNLRTGLGTSGELLKRLADMGLNVRTGMRCDSAEAIKAGVRHRLGIGLAFEDVVKTEARRGEFKVLKGHGLALEGETFIVYRNDRPLSSVAEQFLQLARMGRNQRSELKGQKSPIRGVEPRLVV